MIHSIQTIIGHDFFGVAIFLGLIGFALYLNMPREYQTAGGLALLTAAAPLLLVLAAVITSPLVIMPALFILGIWCARRARL